MFYCLVFGEYLLFFLFIFLIFTILLISLCFCLCDYLVVFLCFFCTPNVFICSVFFRYSTCWTFFSHSPFFFRFFLLLVCYVPMFDSVMFKILFVYRIFLNLI